MGMISTLLQSRRGRRRRLQAEQLIPHIRDLSQSLVSCTRNELFAETANIRQAIRSGTGFSSPEILVAGLSLAVEALRRSHGINLYDVQLLAVIQLAHGRIAQMQTGEGKTFVAISAAAHLALCGRGVHVMTPNTYLAERDSSSASEALSHLGLTVGLTPDQGEPAEKRDAYNCDVTYGTGHEFGFDYLRDQLTLRDINKEPLGQRIVQNLRSGNSTGRRTMQRGLVFAVVDEADSVMFDDATSPLVLSMSVNGEAPDKAAHLLALRQSDSLTMDEDFHLDVTTGSLSMTRNGLNRCYADDVAVPTDVLMRPWTSYVEQALRAKYFFRRDVHYIVAENEVRIVDQTTGRIFDDRSWQDGLHQAIEAREGLPVTPEKESLAKITRQRFFRLYKNLCGMTGTAVGCEMEFHYVYRSDVAEIPLHRPSARELLPTRFFVSRQSKLDAIASETRRIYATQQPVLIGTQSISDSEEIAERLASADVPFELLNGLQTAEEAEVVAQAGQPGAVTIATNLAGRGTDISVPAAALELGGLHVIVAECQMSGRMDRQLIGRSGRQGQPGSAQMFVSADDVLISRFGGWMADAIRREAGTQTEAFADFSRPLRRVQAAAEKHEFLARSELLRQDLARDTLLGQK